MNLLSHPFRLTPSGEVATVEDDTIEAYAEAVAIAALTRRGERDLVPGFGIPDPAGAAGFDVDELNAVLADYGPDVTVVLTGTTVLDDVRERVELSIEEN